jgi:ABC-2 type transport system permease protein
LCRDPLLLALIVYSFTMGVISNAKSNPDAINDAAIAILDQDQTQLSRRICDAFLPPMFATPHYLHDYNEVNDSMDKGVYTFIVVIPSGFQEKVLANNDPEVQLNVDATRMTQAFIGTGYIQNIISDEVDNFVSDTNGESGNSDTAEVLVRKRFNPNLTKAWEGAMNGLVNNVTMLALILTGAALIRERESGTLEHLLVMPVTPFEIMVSKVWSMSLVVLISTGVSLWIVVQDLLKVPIAGSFWLYMLAVATNVFAVTSLGIFLACFAKDMPQLGILMILVLLPMEVLSGGTTSQDNMPEAIRWVMQLAPTTHFVDFSKAILFRGAGLDIVWPIFLKMIGIGALFFVVALRRFRRTVAS